MKNRANETAFVIGSVLRYKELYRYREKGGRKRDCACLSHDAPFLIKPYRDMSFSRKRSPCNGHLSRMIVTLGREGGLCDVRLRQPVRFKAERREVILSRMIHMRYIENRFLTYFPLS